MACKFFERKEHSSVYQKYMIREPTEIQRLIISYLEEKKGKPWGMAVDVGCGTGESTRVLAPHFQKVVGIDISEAQIQEAKRWGSFVNVEYMVAPAEQLPFEDNSVDLITSSVAAHWFNIEEFLREVVRVLKPRGCLALYCLHPHFELQYKDCSQILTDTFKEPFEFITREHGHKRADVMESEYKEIFDAVPFEDKLRFTKIQRKCPMSVATLIGFFESTYMFQNFVLADPVAAKELLQKLKARLLEIMGVPHMDTELEICNNYFCVLACKPL